MMGLGHRRIGFQFADQFIVGLGLLPRQINVENEQRNQPYDRDIVRRRTYLPKLPPIHSCSELVAPESCRLSRGHLAPGGGRDAHRTAAYTAALRKPACLGPDALVRVVERSSTVFCDPPSQPRLARPGRIRDPSLHNPKFTSSVLLLLKPASPAPAQKFRRLYVPARSARSSAPKPQSEFRCNARCRSAAARSRPRSIRPAVQSAHRCK